MPSIDYQLPNIPFDQLRRHACLEAALKWAEPDIHDLETSTREIIKAAARSRRSSKAGRPTNSCPSRGRPTHPSRSGRGLLATSIGARHFRRPMFSCTIRLLKRFTPKQKCLLRTKADNGSPPMLTRIYWASVLLPAKSSKSRSRSARSRSTTYTSKDVS